jgi:hypothetical protein
MGWTLWKALLQLVRDLNNNIDLRHNDFKNPIRVINEIIGDYNSI